MATIDKQEMWRYPRFFSSGEYTAENLHSLGFFRLNDEDKHHAEKVLRMKQGDKAIICDGRGMDYLCEYSTGGEKARPYIGEFKIVESMPNQTEPNAHVRLFQCLPKSDKMDFIVQKSVELGVSEIIPIVSTRCVSRPNPKSADNKICRWNKIAYEAAKQCGRGKVPIVREGDFLSFKYALHDILNNKIHEQLCCDKKDFCCRAIKQQDLNIIFYECGGQRLNEIFEGWLSESLPKLRTINIVIGSEGGFEEAEIKLAEEYGVVPATLGKSILRVDTASITAISIIMNLTGNI